jgi:hypothetical protein
MHSGKRRESKQLMFAMEYQGRAAPGSVGTAHSTIRGESLAGFLSRWTECVRSGFIVFGPLPEPTKRSGPI